jgi:glycosyltransferase involved in cell wall biosynthesis
MPVPQVVLAMNPWCFVPAAWQGPRDRLKAALQRWAYRRTVREAAALVYLSGYLRDAYHALAGRKANRDEVLYAPLTGDVWTAAREQQERIPGRILCVSAMAPHKGCETLVDAVAELHAAGKPVSLALVGGWPDDRYRRTIEARIESHNMKDRVLLMGHLSRQDLLREYGRASVFAILSQCESFGIPGLEAQAFGTPVVCSRAGAMPEIYGQGARTVPGKDALAAARVLKTLLVERADWERLSVAARKNAERFRANPAESVLADLLAEVGRDYEALG